MLNIENLSVELSNKPILDEFSLTLKRGEILCLLGPSGCGKTTALKAISGLIESHQGQIQLFDKTLKGQRYECPPEQRGIGFIFQDYALFPHMTVAQNIAFGLKDKPANEVEQTVEEVLTLVHLQGMGERYPHQLSGGQQQRTAVARALANKPKLLLMDEPFSNIDSQVKHSLMAELRGLLKAHNITCIFVTHAKYEAFSFADKTAVLNNGKIEQLGHTQDVYENPENLFIARFMESGNVINQDAIPEGLFQSTPKVEASENGHWLLKENGFELNAHHGITVEVLDSLYMGNRYRNVLVFGDLELKVESQQPLNVGEHLLIRYIQQPVYIA